MKKAMMLLMCFLFAATLFFPVGTLAAACLGYTFDLASAPAFAVARAVLSVCVAALSLAVQMAVESKAVHVLLPLIAPLSLINAALCLWRCNRPCVVFCVLLSAGCCCFLTIRHGRPAVLKAVALTLSGLMVLPVGLLSFGALMFGGMRQNTVVQTIESPSGEYYAEVVDSDHGALGGDTLVDVYQQGGINALLFKAQKKPRRVYSGDWGEFETMQIHWKNDGCLVINSVKYEIP